jgi:predicted SAM-dependent methyltransferase
METVKRTMKGSLKLLGYQVSRASCNDVDLYYRLYGRAVVEGRRFFNIGAGGFRHPVWTNVDFESKWYVEVQKAPFISWDLLSLAPIPVDDNSAQIVYSSHTIEHVTDEAAQNMFNEAHRILKKDGIVRISTPDVDLAYRAFQENDYHFYVSVQPNMRIRKVMEQISMQQIFLSYFASSVSILAEKTAGSAMESVRYQRIDDAELNNIFLETPYEKALDYCTSKCSLELQRKCPGLHINWWNSSKLSRMLTKAGFHNTYRSGYGQSHSPVLRNTAFFDNTWPQISVFAEAKK